MRRKRDLEGEIEGKVFGGGREIERETSWTKMMAGEECNEGRMENGGIINEEMLKWIIMEGEKKKIKKKKER